METHERVFALEELNSIAFDIMDQMKGFNVIAFSGELGAGKTTLISNLCALLGVKDAVGSPTFSLINEYAYLEDGISKKIFHVDAYRIEDIEEARQVGIEECFDVNGYCFVEWPEHIDQLLPTKTLKVFLSHSHDGNRMIRICK
jgi:tRNA threonylcarbamoyladenosine biosynthesis protein TsaE